VKTLPSQLFVSDEQYRAIGLVICEWGFMEHVAAWSVSELAAGRPITKPMDEPASRILVAGMAFNTLIGLLNALGSVLFPDSIKELTGITKAIAADYQSRSIIAHARWHPGKRPNSISTTIFKSVGKLSQTQHEYTADEIQQLAERIDAHRRQLIEFLKKRGFWQPLEAGPETPPPIGPLPSKGRRGMTAKRG
jgi:HAMP domain-containing protein